MCLLSTTNIPKIADKDIVVYKILYVSDNLSPVRGFHYHKGINVAKGKQEICKSNNRFSIFGGFLHAYIKYNEAFYIWSNFNVNARETHYIVQMIIPKGTEYFISDDGEQICAKQLIWPENT